MIYKHILSIRFLNKTEFIFLYREMASLISIYYE